MNVYHQRLWSPRETLLVRDPIEADALFRITTRTFPELLALAVMPDHEHLVLPHDDVGDRLARAQSAFTRWRNHHRGERAEVWAKPPPVEVVPGRRRGRVMRYVFLNANRKDLVDDPLAWPWTTYREALGLAFPLVGPLDVNPERLHHHVSNDETARIGGTPLPSRVQRPVTWAEVVDAVLAVTRATPDAITRRGTVRALAVQAGWLLGIRDIAMVSRFTGLSRSAIYALVADLPEVDAVPAGTPLGAAIRVAGDVRFRRWTSFDTSPGWSAYRWMR